MLASVLYWKGLKLRGTGEYPGLDAWLAAFEARPAYLATKSDYYTHCKDIPPQYPLAGRDGGRPRQRQRPNATPATATGQGASHPPKQRPQPLRSHPPALQWSYQGCGSVP